MGRVFILAEKPMAAEKLAEPFPHNKENGYIEISKCPTFPEGAYIGTCVGHLIELFEPVDYDPSWQKWTVESLPIFPERYQFKVSNGKEKYIKIIRELLKQSDSVIVATDAGREGSNIAHSVLNYIGDNKPRKRLWISSLTPAAVKKGFENLKDGQEDKQLYLEAKARQISDWQVGINMTRLLTLLLASKGIHGDFGLGNHKSKTFPVGRVQSPVLKIIVDRENKIQQFKSTPFWTLKSSFNINGKEYEGKWFNGDADRFVEKDAAEKMEKHVEGKTATVLSVEKEKVVEKPPQLFNLSSLQKEANKQFSLTPARTLEIVQSLYSNGYLSYPRTDSAYITENEANDLPKILEKIREELPEYEKFFELPVQNLSSDTRYTNPKLVSDHHAILPTELIPQTDNLSNDEIKIYDLVIRRVIAAHHLPAIFDKTKIITAVNDETFRSQGKITVNEGYLRVWCNDKKKQNTKKKGDEEEDQSVLLPPLIKGESGNVQNVAIYEAETKPPARFSPGGLISVMKNPTKYMNENDWEDEDLQKKTSLAELGTEATRAGILEKLFQENLYTIKNNKVYATDKGILLIEALGTKTVLCSPELTAKWEQALGKIGKGKFESTKFIEASRNLTTNLLNQLIGESAFWDFSKLLAAVDEKATLGICPKCNQGAVRDTGKFYGCSAYKEDGCQFGLNYSIAGKKISTSQLKKLLEKGKTDVIKGFKSKSEKTFDAFLYWDNEKQQISFGFPNQTAEDLGVCPKCNQGTIRDTGKFYGCSAYKEDGCRFGLNYSIAGKKISTSQLKKLLEKGKTDVIKGFKSKSEKTFDAVLYWDNEKQKVSFEFPEKS